LLRYSTLKKWLNEWGLHSSRKQAHTLDTIAGPIKEIQKRFPNAGAVVMQGYLRDVYGIRAPKYNFFLFIVSFLLITNIGN
jgi:hypothetical protein